MNEIKNGGLAFPLVGTHEDVIETGMTLRDYFAAQMLPQVWISSIDGMALAEIAHHAYAMADAMLRAREGK